MSIHKLPVARSAGAETVTGFNGQGACLFISMLGEDREQGCKGGTRRRTGQGPFQLPADLKEREKRKKKGELGLGGRSQKPFWSCSPLTCRNHDKVRLVTCGCACGNAGAGAITAETDGAFWKHDCHAVASRCP